jgi:aspartyl-tRNA(Asn)/glutamyl-tRNA(Gln) amidotransferase subunit B
MRSKEESHDYRYFPDPDLLPLELDPTWVEEIKAGLPELPDAKKARFVAEYGLSAEDAAVLVVEAEHGDFFEGVAKGRDGKAAANWVTGELFGALNRTGKTLAEAPVTAEQMGVLLDQISDGTISNRIAKQVFDQMFETGEDPAAIIESKGLRQVSDTGAIEAEIDRILAANADKVAEYRAGKEKLLGFFVGQVMKATQGKANPKIVNEILAAKLKG